MLVPRRGVVLQEPLVGDPVTLDGTTTRLLDATVACIARVGVSKTTLDEVAREAGCSRATLYRYFPGKPALLGGLLVREAAALEAALQSAAAGADSLEDAVVAIVIRSASWLAEHRALQFVITAEPEVLLPHLAFDGADRLLQAGSRVVAPALARFFAPRDSCGDATRAGEWLARMILSYVCSPTDLVDLADPSSVRRLVADFVVPGLTSVTDALRG
jgi:AcrR family transcriptional regulator